MGWDIYCPAANPFYCPKRLMTVDLIANTIQETTRRMSAISFWRFCASSIGGDLYLRLIAFIVWIVKIQHLKNLK